MIDGRRSRSLSEVIYCLARALDGPCAAIHSSWGGTGSPTTYKK